MRDVVEHNIKSMWPEAQVALGKVAHHHSQRKICIAGVARVDETRQEEKLGQWHLEIGHVIFVPQIRLVAKSPGYAEGLLAEDMIRTGIDMQTDAWVEYWRK